ncbi:DUF4390 domain-containing protein [Desulfobotulus mexicanus]|uniref:DUF4390 domain-containing protein n=1 Tax=Desulfobotulus mexicanus TaxID=2586642 RepID=A0A5Q4VJ42_9BACT|nr:DUF4390 domain-containing protein [Desulfobotulus mexicanus]TYT76160.1 DUF4390 domain-containing protein [Desulfobotulus mexicanus]
MLVNTETQGRRAMGFSPFLQTQIQKKTRHHALHCLKALLLFLLLQPLIFIQTADAGEASITSLILAQNDLSIEIHLRTEGAFTPKIEAAVQSGVPVTFSFFLVLESPRRFWRFAEIANITVTHTIRYNAIRESYTVTRSWEGFAPHETRDFEEAKRKMGSLSNLVIAQVDELERKQQYRLRAKAKLSEFTLPLYLHHILFFLSFWDFETDWYSIDFIF